jgi:trehalose 6-phosphate phosphatase
VKPLLAPEALGALRRFARGSVLIALDFDGTLAPIVARPSAAKMRPPTAALLGKLVRLYPCAIITGRHREDVRQRLPPAPGLLVVGNHGLELWPGAAAFRAEADEWLQRLLPALEHLPGVQIEHKIYSLAIHYRRAVDKRAAKEHILSAAGKLEGARLVAGKQVLDVLPKTPITKGHALEWLCQSRGCERAIYVGDDRTDEDVFALPATRVFSVRVGRRQGSAARFYLAGQRAIDDLLRVLVEAREGRASRREPAKVRAP